MAEAAQTQDVTIEERIDRLFYLREDIRRLEAEVKALKGMKTTLEHDILDYMEDEGLAKLGSELATVSVSITERPTVDSEQWPEVFRFLFENDLLEVLRKQLNSGPWEELKKQGVEIPHVSTFEDKKLNLRKA